MCWLHKWTKWERYLWQGKVGARLFAKGEVKEIPMVEATEDRQRRHCEVCGYSQDRLVSSI